MPLRYTLFLILAVLLVRAIWRLVSGFIDGVSGAPPGTRVPIEGVQMARDPVCGTYVVPDRAVAITDGSRRVFFCSTACRDKYRTRTA